MDNMKINNLQQILQADQKSQTAPADTSFKFTLLSSIEESQLQDKLTLMMEEITQQGNKLSRKMDVRDMKHYRALIKDFMNEIAANTHQFSRENFLDRKGRHRVYGIIKKINQTLDELAEELLNEERDNIAILSKIDEIRGLLLDIIT